MSKLDVTQVSSNWKKLQAQLKSEKKEKSEAQSKGLKRKRPGQNPGTGFKKAKVAGPRPMHASKKRKMGMGESKPATNGHQAHNRSTLVMEHGIAPEDVSAAYSALNGTAKRHDDDSNGGLHPSHKAGRYVALDCEMVGTSPPPHTDNVLARTSLVNFHGEQLYDSYVLPPSGVKVEDYRTHVSGIKPGHLKPGVARPFAEVQADVAKLLDGRVLVGHALKNDLQVLFLSHPKRDLRDTSRHPKFRVESMGKPPALRNLAKSELGMSIQAGEHSSIEDARTAMMLYKKEKVRFEEENRRHFGVHHRFERKGGKQQSVGDEANEVAEDDEDKGAILELLTEEEDGTVDAGGHKIAVPNGPKRKRKKKRTKRK